MAGGRFAFLKANPCRLAKANISTGAFSKSLVEFDSPLWFVRGPRLLKSLRLNYKVCYFQVGEGIRH